MNCLNIVRYSLLHLSAAACLTLAGCSRGSDSEGAIFSGESFTMFADSVTDGTYTARALSDTIIESDFPDLKHPRRLTIPKRDDAVSYRSMSRLVDAVHAMSVAQLDTMERIGNTARTAYAVELALAYIDPQKSMELLRERVSDGVIIQGRSTGGGWPVATDGIAWASAAWSVYETTGDEEWLEEAFNVIRRTLERYEAVAFDRSTGLFTGMASSTGYDGGRPYPAWMSAADVASSMSLSVNALMVRAYNVMALMAERLQLDVRPWRARADALREAVNTTLWMPNISVYSQYLYCNPYPIASGTTDNLGQALCMVHGIATEEMCAAMLEQTPVMSLGIPAIYPQLADSTQNPSRALVPAIEGYWAIGAAQGGNIAMLYRSLCSMVRTAAMNLGNYPFADLDTGAIPDRVARVSDDPLSAAANLAAIYRGMLGMRFTPAGLEIHPLIIAGEDNERLIDNFRYRRATLRIKVSGSGSIISSLRIDSIDHPEHIIPTDLAGHHTVEISLAGNTPKVHAVNFASDEAMPPTPSIYWDMKKIGRIRHFVQGDAYEVYINGVMQEEIFGDRYQMFETQALTALSVVPVRAEEYIGYASQPSLFMPSGSEIVVPADSLAYPGTTLIADRKVAARFAETTESRRSRMNFRITVDAGGDYLMQTVYSNGHADQWATSDLCAIRMISVNDSIAGTMVMPPTGKDRWEETGKSNFVRVHLNKGVNRLSIIYRKPYCINGHRTLNTALIESVRLYRLTGGTE